MWVSMTYRVDFDCGERKEFEFIAPTMKEVLKMKYDLDATLKNVAYTEELWEE